MYAPFGAGVLVGPRSAFADGDPFLAGGGAVNLVDLDEVVWTDPPEREEAGSPNVIGAVALHAAIDTLTGIGWPALISHERPDRAAAAGGPGRDPRRPPARARRGRGDAASRHVHRRRRAARAGGRRLAAEEAIGVRHGCFCAHPYLMRLLGLTREQVHRYRDQVRHGDRGTMPGAVRASAGLNTTDADIARLLGAVTRIARGDPPPVPYR